MNLGIILFSSFMILIVMGVPISMAMGSAALIALLVGDYMVEILPLMVSRGVTSFVLLAIPYYILAGNLMNSGGITNRIFNFSDSLVGHCKGGLAQVNVIASMIFSGISGTAIADAAGLGLIEMEAMTKKNYDKGFSAAITLASSVVGPIIPPSVPFLVYAVLAQVSVARMFIAGMIPGIMICLALMLTNYLLVISGKVKVPEPELFQLKKVITTFKSGFFALLAPVIILGGMTTGVVTPTEAGLLAVVYAILVGMGYRELKLKNFVEIMKNSVHSTVTIMFLIGVGSAIGWVVTVERLPLAVTNTLLSLSDSKYTILFLINVILLLLGMVLDGVTIKLIMVPILLPIIDILGISRLHFGVMQTLNTLIGLSTPPVGLGLFVMSSITDLPINKIVRAFLPYYIPLLLVLMLVSYVPFFTTWLPNLLMPTR